MNGAGSCRTVEEVKSLAKSVISIIVVGSFTVEAREGNQGNAFWVGGINDEDTRDIFSLNSRGLPNQGIKYCEQVIPEMAEIVHKAGKLLCVSVAGFTPQEYVILAKVAFALGADIVELNLSCPNVWKDGAQERIACFDPNLVTEILKSVQEAVDLEAKIFVKLSPILDSYLLKEVTNVIAQFEIVKAVVSINTVPNSLLFDKTGRPRITVGQGLAGLGGPAVKPIAIGQVIQLRNLLPKNIDIVYSGGVTHGRDIVDAQLAGAKVVQMCTYLLDFPPETWPIVFARSMLEYSDELEKRQSAKTKSPLNAGFLFRYCQTYPSKTSI
jgi:dihydroorotate dehydrogenase (fumarate)